MAETYAARVAAASKAKEASASASAAAGQLIGACFVVFVNIVLYLSLVGDSAALASPFATPTTAEGEAFTSMLRHIGLTSPVTRAVAGALYNQELARQLADFLRYCGYV